MSVPIEKRKPPILSEKQEKILRKGAYKGSKINWISKNLDKGTCTYKDNTITFTYHGNKKKPIIINLTEVNQKDKTISRKLHELKWSLSKKSKQKFDNRMTQLTQSIQATPQEKKPDLPSLSKSSSSSSFQKPKLPAKETSVPLPPSPSLHLVTSHEEKKKIDQLVEHFEENECNLQELNAYLESNQIKLEQLSLPSIKRLFGNYAIEIPLISLLQKTQNKKLLQVHLEYRVEKFCTFKSSHLVSMANYFINHGIVLIEITQYPSLIEKLEQSNHKETIAEFLVIVDQAKSPDYLKKVCRLLVSPSSNERSLAFPRNLQAMELRDCLSFKGIALEQIISSPESVEILIELPFYRKTLINYAKAHNEKEVLKTCWKFTADRAKWFLDGVANPELVKKYFETYGHGLVYEDFAADYPDMFKVAEPKKSAENTNFDNIRKRQALTIALEHAKMGKDFAALLNLEAYRNNPNQLKKEVMRLLRQGHTDKGGTKEMTQLLTDLNSLLKDGLYDYYLNAFTRAGKP